MIVVTRGYSLDFSERDVERGIKYPATLPSMYAVKPFISNSWLGNSCLTFSKYLSLTFLSSDLYLLKYINCSPFLRNLLTK